MSITPVSTSNSDSTNLNQINNMVRQLNNEQVTKVFKQAGGVDALINGRLPNDLGYGTILYDETGTPLIYMAIVGGQPILKVSPPGVDATTAGDDELLFNSTQNVLKVVASGTVNFTPSNSGFPNYTVTSGRKTGPVVTHNLGFVPLVKAATQRPSVSFDPNVLTELPFLESNGSSSVLINAFYSATSTTLSFFFDFGGSWSFNAPPNFVIKYYLLQESAT